MDKASFAPKAVTTVKNKLYSAITLPKEIIHEVYDSYKLYKRNSMLSPYRRWDMSDQKQSIRIKLEYGIDEVIYLGDIMFDEDAPCDVVRDYIQRSFREKLNEICGDAFLFLGRDEDGELETLDRTREPTNWIIRYIIKEFDKETSKDIKVVVIVVDENAEKVPIEQVVSDDEDDGEDNEMDNLLGTDLDLG